MTIGSHTNRSTNKIRTEENARGSRSNRDNPAEGNKNLQQQSFSHPSKATVFRN
jgi:hypothetical protein